MELNIEAGKVYRTRGGSKGVPLANVHGEYIGYVETRDLHTEPVRWLPNGVSPRLEIYDLVSLWTDPPVVDWDKFPGHIVAVAMDGNLAWYAYTSIPNFSGYRWSNAGAYAMCCAILLQDYPYYSGDCGDSLAIRPGYEEKP